MESRSKSDRSGLVRLPPLRVAAVDFYTTKLEKIMGWIDIRLRKPTVADGDEHGKVWQLLPSGAIGRFSARETSGFVAWMPIPKFTPLPDPPEGYRFVDPEVEKFCDGMKYWSDSQNQWMAAARCMWQVMEIFCVRITPPEPQYRPFASAEEFKPYRDRWSRRKGSDKLRPPAAYYNSGRRSFTWADLLEEFEFEDGTPFGLPID